MDVEKKYVLWEQDKSSDIEQQPHFGENKAIHNFKIGGGVL